MDERMVPSILTRRSHHQRPRALEKGPISILKERWN